jgi:hypothetical protein
VLNLSQRITADVEIPALGAEAVLICLGYQRPLAFTGTLKTVTIEITK